MKVKQIARQSRAEQCKEGHHGSAGWTGLGSTEHDRAGQCRKAQNRAGQGRTWLGLAALGWAG